MAAACAEIIARTGAPAAPTAALANAPMLDASTSSPNARARSADAPAPPLAPSGGESAVERLSGTNACAAPRHSADAAP
jgi:hypothetical protein